MDPVWVVNDQVGSDKARQLLGMKGAAETDDLLKIRIQLMKPVTWIPLIWGKSIKQKKDETGDW